MNLEKILRDVRASYQNMETPNGQFAQTRLDDGMHEEIIQGLSRFYEVLESTDLNDDVSRCVYLKAENFDVNLRISLIGSYSCAHAVNGTFLTLAELENNVGAEKLLQILQESKINFLEESALKTQVSFSAKAVSLYEIMFSSDELI